MQHAEEKVVYRRSKSSRLHLASLVLIKRIHNTQYDMDLAGS